MAYPKPGEFDSFVGQLIPTADLNFAQFAQKYGVLDLTGVDSGGTYLLTTYSTWLLLIGIAGAMDSAVNVRIPKAVDTLA